MSLTFSQYQTALQNWLVMNDTQGIANLQAVLPNIIDLAEQRIYRDLDFLTTETTATGTLTANNRNVAIPSTVIVLNDINIITPSGKNPDDSGATRNPVLRSSVSFINYVWAQGKVTSGTPSIPEYYCPLNAVTTNPTGNTTNLILAPAPDDTYVIEFVGTVRPTPLSSTNTTTFLSTYLPDLFLAASMIYGAGYQQNFSGDSTAPGMAEYWERQYATLKGSAEIEEVRKKSQSQAWTPYQPSPIATPPRS
jgi:hypothetical protein